MNLPEALGILKPSGNNPKELKSAYRLASKLYHPDINPNGLELMKLINLSFSFLEERMGKWDIRTNRTEDEGIDSILSGLFNKIKTFKNIKTEICGTWMWITGNTKKYKDELKSFGFRWSRNKNAWYWHPKGYRRKWITRGSYSMDDIRTCYGSKDMYHETALDLT